MSRPALLFALGIMLIGAGCATTRSEAPVALLVEVLSPPTPDPLHEDDINRFMVDSVRSTFRERGFQGRIEERFRSDAAPSEVPLLTIRLTQWRRTPTGGVDCTFAASIRTAHGVEQPLGQFTATELATTITNRWTLAEAFRDTAERAAEDLWKRLSELQVLPGVPAR